MNETEFTLLCATEWRRWYRRWSALAWVMVVVGAAVFFSAPLAPGRFGPLAVALCSLGVLAPGIYSTHLVRARYLVGREHPDVLLARARVQHEVYLERTQKR